MNNETTGTRRIACQGCRYYSITWEPNHPYACQAHGFKTKRSPALAVYQASGITCQLFSPKKKPDPETVKNGYYG
jgi:hypothetical protein